MKKKKGQGTYWEKKKQSMHSHLALITDCSTPMAKEKQLIHELDVVIPVSFT